MANSENNWIDPYPGNAHPAGYDTRNSETGTRAGSRTN